MNRCGLTRSPARLTTAIAHNNLGNALLQKGSVDEAIAHYQKALQIKPDYAEAHNNLGNALLQKGSVDEAIIHYQKALQIKPDYAEAHNNLGNALLQKGSVDEAIVHYQKALQINPDYAEAHIQPRQRSAPKGQRGRSDRSLPKGAANQPDSAEAQNNLAWVLATAPQASLRNGHQAVELAQRANQLAGGENPIILRTLAAAYAEAGRFSDAQRSAQKAMALAQAAGQTNLVEQLNGELKLYPRDSHSMRRANERKNHLRPSYHKCGFAAGQRRGGLKSTRTSNLRWSPQGVKPHLPRGSHQRMPVQNDQFSGSFPAPVFSTAGSIPIPPPQIIRC